MIATAEILRLIGGGEGRERERMHYKWERVESIRAWRLATVANDAVVRYRDGRRHNSGIPSTASPQYVAHWPPNPVYSTASSTVHAISLTLHGPARYTPKRLSVPTLRRIRPSPQIRVL